TDPASAAAAAHIRRSASSVSRNTRDRIVSDPSSDTMWYVKPDASISVHTSIQALMSNLSLRASRWRSARYEVGDGSLSERKRCRIGPDAPDASVGGAASACATASVAIEAARTLRLSPRSMLQVKANVAPEKQGPGPAAGGVLLRARTERLVARTHSRV